MGTHYHPKLLAEIEAFLSATGMGASYFGKLAVGNSEVVHRLRKNKRVWPETEQRLRDVIAEQSAKRGVAVRFKSKSPNHAAPLTEAN